MKQVTTPSQACVNHCSTALKLAVKAVLRASGRPVKHKCWLSNIRLVAVGTKTKFPVYNRQVDGNVFDWLISTAEHVRRVRQKERLDELEKASAKPESVDRAEVANQKRQAVDARVKSNGGKVPPRSRHQVFVSF
jgi:hypothetical protein